MAADHPKRITPRSKYFGIMFSLACVLGIAAAFGIYAWISSQVTETTHIRVMILMIPFIIMVYAVKYIDGWILAKYPHLVAAKHRQVLAEELGYDPITGTVLGAGYGTPGATTLAQPQPSTSGSYGSSLYGTGSTTH
ncbi:hypothetical protein [Actinomyces qiguomingii]|uniref:hypothetical protein n=1 Tax=Actinomyces qiguomingii TaxID=2057800 RepID=UPI000CA061BE|nr:hypothetical protein [Actinomyces qiguomingii]